MPEDNYYIINKDDIEKLKKKIYYEQIKPLIDKNYSYTKCKNEIEKLCGNEELKININQLKFKNSTELIESLKNNNDYYIINSSLWSNICKNENKLKKGFKIIFNEDKLEIIFNENDKLSIKSKNCIIDNSSLIENKYINKNSNFNYEKANLFNIEEEFLKINNYEMILDSYTCINCKSQIELISIDFKNNNEEDLISYICHICGNIIISIKEYFDKFIFHTYLYEKCTLCGDLQIKQYMNDKNIFIYCI